MLKDMVKKCNGGKSAGPGWGRCDSCLNAISGSNGLHFADVRQEQIGNVLDVFRANH